MDMFEKASRRGTRFDSTVGALTTEDLWGLPLTAKGDRPSLDAVARVAHAKLRDLNEVSFVDETPNPKRADLELQMEIIKHVIAVKKEDAARATRAAETAARKRKLVEALGRVQDRELEGMTADALRAEIEKLSGGDTVESEAA